MPPNTSMATELSFGAPAVGDKNANGGGVRRVPPSLPQQRKETIWLKVLVAGESGQGKTTWLNNNFRDLNGGENPMGQAATVVQEAGRGVFGNGKTLRIEERTFDYKFEGQEFKISLVDTPGYGDHVNTSRSFQPVEDYIVNGNKRYLAEVLGGNDTPEEDGRTDVCIYFIAAHRCKEIDIKYMKQLCKVVTVIPVIGKSDCMTVDEMKDFKAAIVDLAVRDNGLDFFQFSETSWTACKNKVLGPGNTPNWVGEKQPPPYAVISSKVDESGVPARRYMWGTCGVMEPKNSDNAYLKCLLLEVGFQDIKDKMIERHKAFVREQGRPIIEKVGDYIEKAGDYVKARRMSALALAMAALFALLAVVLTQMGL